MKTIDLLMNFLIKFTLLLQSEAQSHKEFIEMFNKFETFYSDAWTKLMYYLGGTAILIPLFLFLINYTVNTSVRKETEKRLELELENFKKNQLEFEKNMNQIATNLIDEIELFKVENLKTINRVRHNAEAVGYSSYADSYFKEKKYYDSLTNYITTAICCLIGEDKFNFKFAFEGILNSVDKIDNSEMNSLNRETKYSNIEFLIYLMKNNIAKMDFTAEVVELTDKLNEKKYRFIYGEENKILQNYYEETFNI